MGRCRWVAGAISRVYIRLTKQCVLSVPPSACCCRVVSVSALRAWSWFRLVFCSRSETRSHNMPHAEAPPHRGAPGDLLLRRHALHGVRIVSLVIYLVEPLATRGRGVKVRNESLSLTAPPPSSLRESGFRYSVSGGNGILLVIAPSPCAVAIPFIIWKSGLAL